MNEKTNTLPPADIDISVLMLFHARPDNFSKVWTEVKRARPSRLFLYQDGPRPNTNDMEGIMKCRSIVSDDEIDWQCEVHRNYKEANQGCDPSGFLSQQWAFSLTEKCMVLEDDVVPSQSFFRFCKEMLDRYEHDERVTMIAGYNLDEESPCQDDYFFTRVFSIWGWASWARVVRNWDSEYSFIHDEAKYETLCNKVKLYKQRRDMPLMAKQHAASGKQYFESIFWAYMLIHDGLAVMPRKNMVQNVGLSSGTHYATQLQLMPKRLRRMFLMERHELSFPLKHPKDVCEDPAYQQRAYLLMAWNNPWRKMQYSMEELWLNITHGNIKHIIKSLFNRLRIILLGRSYH